jgi:hypothetical protein
MSVSSRRLSRSSVGNRCISPANVASSREKELEARIAQLEAKLAKKDAAIADISEEYVKLKKELGEP